MAFERLVALSVVDQETYTNYRKAIRPLLDEVDADFRFDFTIAEVLRSERGEHVNRAFVLRFPDRAASDRFFADPRYTEIKRRLFDSSVAATVVIAEYELVAE